LTKADKESQTDVSANVNQFKRALLSYWDELPNIFVTSSVKRLGRKQILDFIENLRDDFYASLKQEATNSL
jgi:GTP-binding protein